MKSLLSEAWRLERFAPPFTFSAFFSPEDTLLCVCAAESARNQLRMYRGRGSANNTEPGLRIAELTSGSGLVGLYLLGDDPDSTLLGLDVDKDAAAIAASNARGLDFADRARFERSDLWSPDTLDLLRKERPQVLICNPPYVPEPPGKTMQLEAGAGPHGTAHLLRALELTRALRPAALALSWCSLSDPVGIVTAAEDAGYHVSEMFVTAIADGEYSGSVHDYLRVLDNCYINEQPETLATIASDGAARFAYLLFAASFAKRDREPSGGTRDAAVDFVRGLCENFARDGLHGFARELPDAEVRAHRYILDRWDELQLRVMLHGVPAQQAESKG